MAQDITHETEKVGYPVLDPVVMMEWTNKVSWIMSWREYIELSQAPITAQDRLEKMANQQRG